VLAIAPTRALVNDLHARLSPLLEELGLSCGRQTSDHPAGGQLPFLLITTPESFDSLLARRSVYDRAGRLESHALMGVQAVFIDEVHLFDNSARGDQLLWLLARLRRLRRLLTGSQGADMGVHICAASATVSDPQDLADRVLGARARVIIVPGGRELVIHCLVGGGDWVPVSRAHAALDLIPSVGLLRNPDSLEEVAELVWLAIKASHSAKAIRKVLVFVPSRALCDQLAVVLRNRLERERATSVFAHHGSLDRSIREESERRFGRERDAVLVATSTLEVGVDIGDVDAVTLVGPPPNTNGLLQRIGRSGRREGFTRVVAIARRPGERFALASMLFAARDGICDPVPYGRRWSVCVQQAASFVFQGPPQGRRKDDLVGLAREVWGEEAGSYQERVLAHLQAVQCLEARHGDRLAIGSEWQQAWDGMGMHANIDSGGSGTPVVNAVTGETIAVLPAGSRVEGEVAIAGQTWHARIDSGEVLVEGTRSKRTGAGVRYAAKSAPMGHALARHVALGLGLGDRLLVTVSHSTGPYIFHFGGHLYERILKAIAPNLQTIGPLSGIALGGTLDPSALASGLRPDRTRHAWYDVLTTSAPALGCGPHHKDLPVELQTATCEELFPLESVSGWLSSRELVSADSVAGVPRALHELLDEAMLDT
jgi:ATP-dependent Lhr-like helicase